MDKASAYRAGDCGFEFCRGHSDCMCGRAPSKVCWVIIAYAARRSRSGKRFFCVGVRYAAFLAAHICAICRRTVEKFLFNPGWRGPASSGSVVAAGARTVGNAAYVFNVCLPCTASTIAQFGVQRHDGGANLRACKFWNASHQPSGNLMPTRP